MGFFLLLSLALLQALTGTVPSHRSSGWQDALRAPLARAVRPIPGDVDAVAHAPGSLYQALSQTRGIAGVRLDRTAGHGSSAGGSRVAPSLSAASLPQARFANVPRGSGQSEHAARRIASRGSLLPYYPTAPPG